MPKALYQYPLLKSIHVLKCNMHVHILNTESMKPIKKNFLGILRGDGPQPPNWRHWSNKRVPVRGLWLDIWLYIDAQIKKDIWSTISSIPFQVRQSLLRRGEHVRRDQEGKICRSSTQVSDAHSIGNMNFFSKTWESIEFVFNACFCFKPYILLGSTNMGYDIYRILLWIELATRLVIGVCQFLWWIVDNWRLSFLSKEPSADVRLSHVLMSVGDECLTNWANKRSNGTIYIDPNIFHLLQMYRWCQPFQRHCLILIRTNAVWI